jgi:hypothetical protein
MNTEPTYIDRQPQIDDALALPIFSPTTKMAVALAANRDQRGLHIYAGTVAPKTKAKRRAANKVAKASRKDNR